MISVLQKWNKPRITRSFAGSFIVNFDSNKGPKPGSAVNRFCRCPIRFKILLQYCYWLVQFISLRGGSCSSVKDQNVLWLFMYTGMSKCFGYQISREHSYEINAVLTKKFLENYTSIFSYKIALHSECHPRFYKHLNPPLRNCVNAVTYSNW